MKLRALRSVVPLACGIAWGFASAACGANDAASAVDGATPIDTGTTPDSSGPFDATLPNDGSDAGDGNAMADGRGAPLDAGDVSPINGTLVIHWYAGGRVLLGDGTAFDAVVPSSGVVTFASPSIIGPQTVTCIDPPNFGGHGATTIVGIDRVEVFASPRGSGDFGPLAHVVGSVSSIPDADVSVELSAIGRGTGGGGNVSAGTYGFDVLGPSTARSTDIVALAIGSGITPLGAGASLDVPLPAAGSLDAAPPVVSAPNVVIDHPFDQTLAVTVTNFSTVSNTVNFNLRFYRGDELEISWFDSSLTASTNLLKTITPTPPFDVFQRVLIAYSGATGPSSTTATASALVMADAGAVSLTYASSPRVISPSSAPDQGDAASPVVSFAPGAQLAWQLGDVAAQIVVAHLGCQRQETDGSVENVHWVVYAPAAAGAFAFFALPADTGVPFFCPGSDVSIGLESDDFQGASVQEVLGAVGHYDVEPLYARHPSAQSSTFARFRMPAP